MSIMGRVNRMSVLIKGMEMPKNCDDCFFIGRGYPDWCSFPQIPNGEDEIYDTKKRPDWCPLIELPEKHGRLVDANMLIEELKGCHFPGAPYVDAGISIAIGKICDAPTVIEAEGDEE